MLKEIFKSNRFAVVIAFFGFLLILAAIFSIQDIAKFNITPRKQIFLPSLIIGIILISISLVYAYFAEDRKGFSDVLRGFPDRNQYFKEIIDQIEKAERQILMCVHTLNSAEPGNEIEKLHQLLSKKARNLEIKILAPTGEKRTRASYQIAQSGISVRHLSSLQHLDVSFSLFDSSRAVLPTESGNNEETVAGITISSTKLVELLQESFDELWWRFDALNYPNYIRYTVNNILANTPRLPLKTLSERLNIPSEDLSSILPAYETQPDPIYFFVIGRPGSGKTTVSEKIMQQFKKIGIQEEQIYYFNDYEVLYERFVGDKNNKTFEKDKRGGFAVRDFSVLDIVLCQANFEIAAAKRFFQVFIIEFARDSYLKALLNFDRGILANSIVIHVKCTLETCLERNSQRRGVTNDHRSGYVPEPVMKEFYANENVSEIKNLGIPIKEIDTDTIDLSRLDNTLEAILAK